MNDPLIVHVENFESAMLLVDIDDDLKFIYKLLTSKYWPGPLTLVVRANDKLIPPTVTAGTGSVGIRCPNHKIALELIHKSGVPIAAPSANKFGHVSPTKPQHVLEDFIKDDVLIIDGGACSFGIESTVAKLLKEKEHEYLIMILRKGGISQESLQNFIEQHSKEFVDKNIKLRVDSMKHKVPSEPVPKMPEEDKLAKEAPGMMLKHYSPHIDTYIIEKSECIENPIKSAIIDFGKTNIKLKDKVKWYKDLSEKSDVKEAIANIYEYLRQAEIQEGVEKIYLANMKNEDLVSKISANKEHLEALYDRMFRAAAGKILK